MKIARTMLETAEVIIFFDQLLFIPLEVDYFPVIAKSGLKEGCLLASKDGGGDIFYIAVPANRIDEYFALDHEHVLIGVFQNATFNDHYETS